MVVPSVCAVSSPGLPDVDATDLSVLGRDVVDHFDVLLSRRRNEVVLLAQRHRSRVEQA